MRKTRTWSLEAITLNVSVKSFFNYTMNGIKRYNEKYNKKPKHAC